MSTAKLGAKPMRLRLLNLIDVLLVTDAEQIKWLNQQVDVVRPLDPNASWLHRILDGRTRGDLMFDGAPLPVFLARADKEREQSQQKLAAELEGARGVPGKERDEISAYVSGKSAAAEIGETVQRWCGRLFLGTYRNDKDTYSAGQLIANWPSSPPWRTIAQRADGRLARAKRVLSNAAAGDRQCIHATSIGMENIVKTVRKLRKAAGDPAKRMLSPDDALRDCLAAPPAVLRGCAHEVSAPFLNRPLTKRTVIVFLLAQAYQRSGDLDVAFLSDGWSACPAREVIPEMLRAAWHGAHHDEPAQDKPLLSRINGLSRIFRIAV
jgi:hypothetical protein